MTANELRAAIQRGEFDAPTTGYCPDNVQANLVALPLAYADDFERFCKQNPKPCPLLEKVGPNSSLTSALADGADLKRCIARYKIFVEGVLSQEVKDIGEFYQDDFVFFLLGCSFSFEDALIKAGIPLRHIQEKKNVSMYTTNIPLASAGPFKGEMVVSMRPIPAERVVDACVITAHYPGVHGAPVHVGYPELIGISDLAKPDFGDPVDIFPGEIPLFWACGVTPQNALRQAKLPIAVTHAPGYMFVGDARNEDYYEILD